MDSSTDEKLRSIAQSLTALQQISSAGLLLGSSIAFTRSLQRKLETLLKCNMHDTQGPSVAMRSALSVVERAVCDLTAHLQAQQHEKISLWTAIRSHGCQFLGPAMQEEVLKLILLALEDGSSLSRKVLVLFVVQRLHLQFPQASKTSVGHVVQLLYRASCFNVIKRDEESSLMQLKEEFRNYEELRSQHDMQIVEISRDFGLRIGPEQWSCLLYGDSGHRSHMQSIIDKVLKRQTLLRSAEELMEILQKSGDPLDLSTELQPLLNLLVDFQKNSTDLRSATVDLSQLDSCLKAVVKVISALSRSLQLKQRHKVDPGPGFANHPLETGVARSSREIKLTDVAKLDLFGSPAKSSSKLHQPATLAWSESLAGNERECCQAFQVTAQLPVDSLASDDVSDVTTAMRSVSLSGTEVQCSSSSVITEDGFYRLLSTCSPSRVAPSPHAGYSLCKSLPYRSASHSPFFSPPLNVGTNEQVCTPLSGGFCPSPVLVSVRNLPGPSEFFHPVWYPAAAATDDYGQCALMLNATAASNHLSN